MNNSEASDDIISVMRNIVGQFQTKLAADNEGIDVSLSVRLWKISGFHEMLASLGFDLMDVGQDQVTLRTGKQANKRNCQFVLQSLLALFTQEAPKTIGMDSASSSSTESLNETVDSDVKSQKQRRDQNLAGSAYHNFPRPIIAPRKMTTSSRSAFISYQKRRGEPDGGHEDAIQQQKLQPTFENTDSELSDGYATQKMLAKYTGKDLCYGGLRGTTKICRPGGGGESDATFTPSPIDNNVSMALAHQTRIRNLYTNINEATSSGVVSKNGSRRPDSSSSASSATDWDSGHATVLRRANNAMQGATLPMPATRQLLPIVDNLRPTAPVYNNLLVQCGMKKTLGIMESTSSDSEGWIPSQTRNKIKLHQQYIQQAHQKQHQVNSHYQDIPAVSVAKIKEQFNFIDRLSVRTEASKTNGGHRKTILKPSDEMNMSGNSLYFSPAELQNTTTNLVEDDSGPSSVIHHPPTHSHHKMKESKTNTSSGVPTGSSNTQKPSKNILQDSIMRHMSREMAPAISDVYHERNIGLISAPPLSKLLMTNYEENETTGNVQAPVSSPTSGLNKLMSAIDLSEEITSCTSSTAKLLSCGGASHSDEDFSVEDEAASSQTTLKSAPKNKSFSSVPWLSSINAENILKPSDLTTAEILEHQKIKSTSSSSSNSDHLSVLKSPYSEFRDDADGHSQCSSLNKNSLPSQQIRNNIY